MDNILLVVQGIIALALVGCILMQRSEGGALGIGGGPGGMMSARGAGNFLTRATTILAVIFIGMCILLAIRSGIGRGETLMEGFDAAGDPLAAESQSGLPAVPQEDDVTGTATGSIPDLGTIDPDAPMSMGEAMDVIDPNAMAVPLLPDEIPAADQ